MLAQDEPRTYLGLTGRSPRAPLAKVRLSCLARRDRWQAVHNLNASGCAGIVQGYLTTVQNRADLNRKRMLTYMRDGCCSRLPDS